MRISENGPFIGHREKLLNGNVGQYIWQSYETVLERAKNFACGLAEYISPKDCIGIYSINRPEWTITEQACFYFNYITVPLYDTFGQEAIEYIIRQTDMALIVTSSDKIMGLLNCIHLLPSLKTIVSMDLFPDDVLRKAEACSIHLVALVNVEKKGQEVPKLPVLPTSDDLATICYTSGTTGVPKGAMLTHRNFLSVAYSLFYGSEKNVFNKVTKEDVHISYLPLAHVFERAIHQVIVYHGARIGFYQGDTLKLLQDITVLRPTLFISVPRLFNRIHDKVWTGVREKGGAAAYLFNTAYQGKKNNLRKGQVSHWLWDRLVFSNVRAKLGGRIRFLFSGSAPISKEVMDFLRICFSCEVYEGYGQTETTAGIAVTWLGDTVSGHLGSPLSCNQVKLVDVPHMQYTSKDIPCPRGEIYVKGPSVFVGYYKQPELTKSVLTEDGWCATGDIGMWDTYNRLVIIDRVKHIFKLSQGEYVAPEKIENIYAQHELVQQCYVYGHSLKSSLVGLVVLDPDALAKFPLKKTDSNFNTKVLEILNLHSKKSGLKGFELLKSIHIVDEPFSIENGLMTPTFKLRRSDIQSRFQPVLDALNQALD
ncbi:Long chain acyl-CoA synthetase 7 peroxisomal [Coelomomyces lativittatus]|nr:Long chain acyl-CoA synthetase 7 peroxisomal [Coelomomyces lativittatus]